MDKWKGILSVVIVSAYVTLIGLGMIYNLPVPNEIVITAGLVLTAYFGLRKG